MKRSAPTPPPEVEAYRDAVTVPKTLGFTDILDLLSEESLACTSPRLHRGWEDRVFSCKRSRKTARGVIPIALGETARAELLLLSAYRNRIFRLPPPVRIDSQQILPALESLTRLVDGLRAR